jgi:single-strand DNA-binding protein
VVSGGRQGAARVWPKGTRRTVTGGLEDADMINDSHIDLAGFVASEPAFKRIAGGTSTAKLRVAYTERRFDRETGEWADGPTSFVTVLCWRTLADNVAVCLRKGEPVLVRGRLRVREYEGKEGASRIAVEVEASSVGHDLSRGVAHFSRTRRAPGETAAENAEALAAAQAQDGEEPAGRDEPGLPCGPAGGPAGGDSGAVVNGTDGNGASGNGAGDGVLDERAVAEFASDLTEAVGEVSA